jgi:hypothetical protein
MSIDIHARKFAVATLEGTEITDVNQKHLSLIEAVASVKNRKECSDETAVILSHPLPKSIKKAKKSPVTPKQAEQRFSVAITPNALNISFDLYSEEPMTLEAAQQLAKSYNDLRERGLLKADGDGSAIVIACDPQELVKA